MFNKALDQLNTPYLFGEITKLAKEHPDPVDLGVGDTTLPLPDVVIEALKTHAADALCYGPEHGNPQLRERITSLYYPMCQPDEIFISDGIKTDLARLQGLFDPSITIALQDPTYPTYKEGAIVSGKHKFTPFSFPNLPKADLYIICSPNNPTGEALTKSQLTHLIETAKENQALIIYDSAYASFISDPKIPRSPYEIEGAREVVIELGSFSKLAGFTGLRLSWSVVPKELKNNCHALWSRIISATYNGTSKLIQEAGLAALSNKGLKDIENQMAIYHHRASTLRNGLLPYFPTIYGGIHAPYLWIPSPQEPFAQLGIITIPGNGFGPRGKGFVRLSAFADDQTIYEAVSRCSQLTAAVLT